MASNQVITVLEADGSTQTDVEILGTGRQVASASKSIALSTEDKVVVDAVNAILGASGDAASASTTIKAALRGLATALGVTALDLGIATGGSRTIRVAIDSAQLAPPITASSAYAVGVLPVALPTDQVPVATKAAASAWADGADVTLGAKADAKSTATDATAITIMQVLKQISASVQAPPSQAVTNAGTFAVQASNTALTNFGAGEYEPVGSSATDQILGPTGAVGDYLAGILITPTTTGAGSVSIKDGNGSAIPIFNTGTLSNLVPFYVPLGVVAINSTTPGWKVTTGTNVTVLGIGNFT